MKSERGSLAVLTFSVMFYLLKKQTKKLKCLYMTKYYNFTSLSFGTWVLFILHTQIFCRPETYYNF